MSEQATPQQWWQADAAVEEPPTDDVTEVPNEAPTALTPDPDPTPPEAPEATWPSDWLDKVSKGDEKRANMLKRYASPEAVADALIAAQTKLRSGELKAALPDNPSEAQLKEWRKENGIPETPESYDTKFESGLVIGDQDKSFVDEFKKIAHAGNMRPDQFKSTVEWYYGVQERQAEERNQLDIEQEREVQDQLYAEYGEAKKLNMKLVTNTILSRFPEETQQKILAARMPDGTSIFNDIDVLRTFVGMALEINPAGISVPAGGGDLLQGTESRLAEIKGWMNAPRGSDDSNKYWKDEKVRAEYRTLLEQRDKLNKP